MFRAPKRLGLKWQCCTLDQGPRCIYRNPPVTQPNVINIRFFMKKLHSLYLWFPVLLAVGGFSVGARAASVGPAGYTNDFSTVPPAADWATAPISGAAANITTTVDLDAAVQATPASSVTAAVVSDATEPPAFNGSATWASTGLYLQTRPTGVNATVLMCTLVNNLGAAAASVTVSYDFTKVTALAVAEEVDGQRAFYSLTGDAGSWTLIPSLTTATSGRGTANLKL